MATPVEALLATSEELSLSLVTPRRVGRLPYLSPWGPDTKRLYMKRPPPSLVRKKRSRTPGGFRKSQSSSQPHSPGIKSQVQCQDPNHDYRGSILHLFTRGKDKQMSTPPLKESNHSASLNERKVKHHSNVVDGGVKVTDSKVTPTSSILCKPSLPALITLTSDYFHPQATFGLSKQDLEHNHGERSSNNDTREKNNTTDNSQNVENDKNNDDHSDNNILINIPRLSMSAREPDTCEETMIKTEVISEPLWKNAEIDDAINSPNKHLNRALAKRLQVPPSWHHEDISQHMRYYRMHHTVMGTGRCSLANTESKHKSDIHTVRWEDVFPNRPLSAVTDCSQVPTFRLNMTDIQSNDTKLANHGRVPSPRPPNLTPNPTSRLISREKVTENPDWQKTENSACKRRHLDPLSEEGDSDCADHEIPLKYEPSTCRQQKTNYNLYNNSITPIMNKTEHVVNDYKTFLKRGDKTKTRDIPAPSKSSDNRKLSEKSAPAGGKTKRPGFVISRAVPKMNYRQSSVPPPLPGYDSFATALDKDKWVIGNLTDRRNAENEQGTHDGRYIGSFYQRRILSAIQEPKSRSSTPQVHVDADKFKESVNYKINELNKKLTHSIFKKSRKDDDSYVQFLVKTADSKTSKGTHNAPARVEQIRNSQVDDDQTNIRGQTTQHTSINGKGGMSQYSRLAQTGKKIGIVTSYDFCGYTAAAETMTGGSLNANSGVGLLMAQRKKLHTPSIAPLEPPFLDNKSQSFLLRPNRNWCPNESRAHHIYSTAENNNSSEMKPNNTFYRSMSRESSSSSMKYKPTSPAASAFVIAAPPSSPLIGRHSVVMPLEEFMQFAMEGKEKTFMEWSSCLNDSSKLGMSGSSSKSRNTSRHRDEGLLRVVSFATPVNQFIFAKKVTQNSAEHILDSVSSMPCERPASVVERALFRKNSRQFRLRLRDCGIFASDKKQRISRNTSGTNGAATQIARNEKGTGKENSQDIAECNVSNSTLGQCDANSQSKSNCTDEKDVTRDDETDIIETADIITSNECSVLQTTEEDESEQKIQAFQPKVNMDVAENTKNQTVRSSSAKDEFHGRLRRQILQLLETRRVRSATGPSKTNENAYLTSDSEFSFGGTNGMPENISHSDTEVNSCLRRNRPTKLRLRKMKSLKERPTTCLDMVQTEFLSNFDNGELHQGTKDDPTELPCVLATSTVEPKSALMSPKPPNSPTKITRPKTVRFASDVIF